MKEEVLRSPGVSKSTRRLSEITGFPHSSVYTILKELKLKPYIPRLRQKLSKCDYDHTVEFCEAYSGLLQSDPDLADKITFQMKPNFNSLVQLTGTIVFIGHTIAPKILMWTKPRYRLVSLYGVA